MSINNEDLMLVNRSGVDYKTTVADLTEYVNFIPPMPWDGHDGVIFHVRNATEEVKLYSGYSATAWDIDGTNPRQIDSFHPGEEIVFVTGAQLWALFAMNKSANWEFGELTDVSNGENFESMFTVCKEFNADISDWDVSNLRAGGLDIMFDGCSKFNQDLSQWCVSQIPSKPYCFDRNCTSWTKPKPVWGTCPRGEDQ